MKVDTYGTGSQLDLLVCSIDTRADFLGRLVNRLVPQLGEHARLTVWTDGGDISIGQKRREMLAAATGDYVAFIDDDDDVADTYVADIVTALEAKPDAVGMMVRRMVDGVFDADGIHSMRFDNWRTETIDGVKLYIRTINHLNPVRRDIAQGVSFNNANMGEDHDYSMRMRGRLQSEVFIPRPLYLYLYRSRRPNEQTHRRRHQRVTQASDRVGMRRLA
jgi:glycosyltransferase involved in cell wall biosynthesis